MLYVLLPNNIICATCASTAMLVVVVVVVGPVYALRNVLLYHTLTFFLLLSK